MEELDYTIILDTATIHKKVKEVGKRISEDFSQKPPLVLGVLKGSVFFLADLMRAVDLPYTLDFIGVSSYKESTESSGKVEITFDLSSDFTGKHILIVEDIIDTGITLDYLTNHIRDRGAEDISVAVLLDKPSRRKVEVNIDYVCFEVKDAFYVGYGLDYQGRLRNLPYIARLNLA